VSLERTDAGTAPGQQRLPWGDQQAQADFPIGKRHSHRPAGGPDGL